MDKTKNTIATSAKNDPLYVAGYHKRKVVAERILGSALLVIAAPLIGLIVAVVRATSSGKGIYKQTRVGKGGHEFQIYKIRTMRKNAETQGDAVWSTPEDDRITRVGKVLRHLHLDELPQLANVARGQMSLIGPRPERPEFVAILEQRVPNYLDRLSVLPGVTGLAQINLPADASLESVRKKVVLDREYIKTAKATLDFRIFFCTLFRMTGFDKGVTPKMFGVECDPDEVLLSVDGLCDTSELAAPLDDTKVNVASQLAAPLVTSKAVLEPHYQTEHPSDLVTVEAPLSISGQQAPIVSPRRPR